MAGFFQSLKRLLGFGGTTRTPSGFRASVDAARTTDENKNHWAAADFFSADAAFNPAVRFKLRNRARYETLNNTYCKSSVRSAADDLIGTGPRLQVTIPGDTDGAQAKVVEKTFASWAAETRLAMDLRIAEKSRVRDGGCFGIFTSNPKLAHPVKLYIKWLEDEMCATPWVKTNDPYMVDGIQFDDLGNPVRYYFLKYHPGSVNVLMSLPSEYYMLPAEQVIHWYAADRFGQHRGIPEITPALPLFSQLRRYTLATLTAAEFASMISGILKSNFPVDTGNIKTVDQWDLFEVVRGALLTLPEGYDATGFKSEQPTTTYPMFKQEILTEIGRALSQPSNIVIGNSNGSSFSAGRLDHIPYQRGIGIIRNDLRLTCLTRILQAFDREARMVGEYSPDFPKLADWSICWNYDGFGSIDQAKDAIADDSRIKNGTATYSEIFAEHGQDAFEQFAVLAKEKAECERLGLPWPILSQPAPAAPPAPAPASASSSDGTGDGEDQPPVNGHNRLNGYTGRLHE